MSIRVFLTIAGVTLSAVAAADERPIRLAQSTDTTTSAPTVTPVTPNSSSATCLSGCSSQALNCQNTCISTINGTTIMPSVTSAGVTSSPSQCSQNCSLQQQMCQRGCLIQ